MTHPDAVGLVDEHSKNVEPIVVASPSVPIEPDPGAATEFSSLPPVHRLRRIAKSKTATRLDLDEGNNVRASYDQIEIAMSDAESPVKNLPSATLQPSGRDALSQRAKLTGDH